MLRQAMRYSFSDGVGLEKDSYIGNDDKILKFLDWYQDFCLQKNEILFVSGPTGCGRSTLIQHCTNFISKKANYELLRQKGLNEQVKQVSQLPKAKVSWVSAQEVGMTEGSFIKILCEKVKPQGFFHGISPYISPSFSNGPGSPEISLKLGTDFLPRIESMESLVDYLRKKESEKYIVWFKSLPEAFCSNLVMAHNDIKACGVSNLGIIISLDRDFDSADKITAKEKIVFAPISPEELSLFIMAVCRQNNVRFDLGLAEIIVSQGYNTFGKALKLLQALEKMDSNYISKVNAISAMEGNV